MKRAFKWSAGLTGIAITGFLCLAPSLAFAQATIPSSCPTATVQDTIGSSLQQLTEVADQISVENLPQSVLAADETLISAISQVILQVTQACLSTGTTAPVVTQNTTPAATPTQTQTTSAPSPTPSNPAISLNGAVTGSYTVNDAWTLTLSSPFDTTNFTLCDTQNGVQSCTPNWGTTNAYGNWVATGNFNPSTVGAWTEWATFPDGVESNKISFTVAAAAGSNTGVNAITGVQGYDPITLAYTDGTAITNTYLIVYGNFSATGNSVVINGNAVTPSYQSTNQLNVPLAGISPATQNTITVTTATGITGSANFTITNPTESTGAPSSAVSASTVVSNAATNNATLTPTSCSGSPALMTTGFPVTVLVTAQVLNVRSAPSTVAALTGSQTLSAGNTVTAVNEVQGTCVESDDLWWETSTGSYIWAGGTTIEATTPEATTPVTTTPTTPIISVTTNTTAPGVASSASLPAAVTKTVTSGGTSYAVTYSYLADGEVRATFVYKGLPYAVQNYNTNLAYAEAIARVLAPGVFGTPWGAQSQADTTLVALANQISISAPADVTVFPGFKFVTPLWFLGPVSTPTNDFYIDESPYLNVVPGLYSLDINSAGVLIGVTPITVLSTGVITAGTEIMLGVPGQSSAKSTTGGGVSGSLGAVINYCSANPFDAYCSTWLYCFMNPSDPACVSAASACALAPLNPSCSTSIPVTTPSTFPSGVTATSTLGTLCDFIPSAPHCSSVSGSENSGNTSTVGKTSCSVSQAAQEDCDDNNTCVLSEDGDPTCACNSGYVANNGNSSDCISESSVTESCYVNLSSGEVSCQENGSCGWNAAENTVECSCDSGYILSDGDCISNVTYCQQNPDDTSCEDN